MRILITLTLALVIANLNAQLTDLLPLEARNAIIWYADLEEGTLDDWDDAQSVHPGGEIYRTGGEDTEIVADNRFAHSGKFSARASITNAYRAENGDKGIKLRRWADDAINEGGNPLPTEGYYSSFLYIPHIYNPTKEVSWNTDDEGYWNIFDFGTINALGETETIWAVNARHDASTNKMYLFLQSDHNDDQFQIASSALSVPVNKWMHLETYYKCSDIGVNNGSISVWQDGQQLFEVNNVVTTIDNKMISWSVGNTTDHIEGESVEGRASIYIDDSMISSKAIHPFLEASVALPLELVSFDVYNSGQDVEVKWSTTNESNIKFYKLQRRHESEAEFYEFRTLRANNNDASINNYDVLDLDTKKVGLNYYRLKVLDNDGQEYYSDLQSITIKGGNLSGIRTFPNPVQNEIYIEGLNDDEEMVFINVFDVFGKLMLSKTEVTRLKSEVNLSDLTPGTYFMQVSKGLNRYAKKIVKL